MSLSILVLLLPPNKHAFTAKAVWADFKCQLFWTLHAVAGLSKNALYSSRSHPSKQDLSQTMAITWKEMILELWNLGRYQLT